MFLFCLFFLLPLPRPSFEEDKDCIGVVRQTEMPEYRSFDMNKVHFPPNNYSNCPGVTKVYKTIPVQFTHCKRKLMNYGMDKKQKLVYKTFY